MKITAYLGGVLVGCSLAYLICYNLLKLCYFLVRKCWKHKPKIDISAFSTGEIIIRDGTCKRECIFSKSCSRHATENGLEKEEADRLLQLVEDYKNKTKTTK